jgi:hypothetical protein
VSFNELCSMGREFRSLADRFPPDRSSPGYILRPMSPEQPICGHAHPVCQLPPARLRGFEKSAPWVKRDFDGLRGLSYHNRMAAFNIRSQQNALCAHGSAHGSPVRPMPSGWKVCGHADDVCQLSSGEIHRNCQSSPRIKRNLD